MNEQNNDDILGMTAATLGQDLLGLVIQECKAMPDVWQMMSQYKQDEVIERARIRVENATRKAVNIILTNGRTAIVADLEGVAIKDKIKATLVVSRANDHDNMNELFSAINKPCLIVVSDASAFTGGMDQVQGEPDQPGFAFDASDDASVDAEFNEVGLPAPVPEFDGDDASLDPLYERAIDRVISDSSASVAFLQVAFGIEESRARLLIEQMETDGIVSPPDANGARLVFGRPQLDEPSAA